MTDIGKALEKTGLFKKNGAFVLVDGQYGSTGKGLAASVLAEHFHDQVDVVTSNAGPNSGHTFYHGDEKIVLMQLPTFAVKAEKMGTSIKTYMNAGAIVDPSRLAVETIEHRMDVLSQVNVNPLAAYVDDKARAQEKLLKDEIGSTGKGTGAALARKIMRDPRGVIGGSVDALRVLREAGVDVSGHMPGDDQRIFVEVSQGFSLSMNADKFYPFCTSRDCTVAQAISDAGLHPSMLHKSMMVVRTFPIRVGGNSGDYYPDQSELDWGDINVEPETTTVTGKQRRLFSWSQMQYEQALRVNRPNYIFVNFMNYLPTTEQHDFVRRNIWDGYTKVMGHRPEAVLLGFGPKNEHVMTAELC